MPRSYCLGLLQLGLAALLGLASCADEAQSDDFKTQKRGWSEIEWQTCPTEIPGFARAQCASLEVAIDPSNPASSSISIFLRRIRPAGLVKGQLWALDGGPGEPGDGFMDGWFPDLVTQAGYELIVPTHRGVAYATTLSCGETTGLESCIGELASQWGSNLKHFDTHAAAQDLVQLARAYRPTNGEALIFGGSYGTVWLQRVLEADPELFAGAYLDSAGTVNANFELSGTWAQAVGEMVLEHCSKLPACAEHFAGGVQGTLERVTQIESAGQGCLAKINHTWPEMQQLLFEMLNSTTERELIAPVVKQLDRCSDTDRRALAPALAPKVTPRFNVTTNFNLLVNLVVIFRELYTATLPIEQVFQLADGLAFGGPAMKVLAKRRALFPKDFERASNVLQANYIGPMHIVQGRLDPLLAPNTLSEIENTWKGAKLDVVELPFGGHASVRFTTRIDQERCSSRWLLSFLNNPQQPLDRSCMDQVPTPNFGGSNRSKSPPSPSSPPHHPPQSPAA